MRRLLDLTDIRRTPEGDRLLGALLAFNAGAVNAGGFLAVHMYTSHMTGFVSLIADHLVLGNGAIALGAVGALVSFCAGAMTTAILVNWARRKRLRGAYALPLGLEALLMLVFGLLGASLGQQGTAFVVPLTVLLLAFLMGLQNAVVTKISSSQVRTTHMTGVVTDLGIELGKLLYWNRDGAAEPRVEAHRGRLRLLALLLAMFLAGGIAGAAGFAHAGFVSVLPLALALLALALPPIVHDLRGRPVAPL